MEGITADVELDGSCELMKDHAKISMSAVQVGDESVQVGDESVQVGDESVQVGDESVQVGDECSTGRHANTINRSRAQTNFIMLLLYTNLYINMLSKGY